VGATKGKVRRKQWSKAYREAEETKLPGLKELGRTGGVCERQNEQGMRAREVFGRMSHTGVVCASDRDSDGV
jgi:hypothetical protein